MMNVQDINYRPKKEKWKKSKEERNLKDCLT